MRKQVRDFLEFHKGEQRGIIVLVAILLLVIASTYFVPLLMPEQKVFSTGFLENAQSLLISATGEYEKEEYSSAKEVVQPPERFRFNPNNLPHSEWRRLGLKDWQVKTIFKFEAKGGSFKIKADLAKMYPISDELFLELEPYIDLPDSLPRKEKAWEKKELPSIQVMDINTADSAAWVRLRGIGPATSKMILKYRSKLGGFHSVSQLAEVYLMKPEVLEQNALFLTVDSLTVKRININKATVKELKDHPYVSWNIANSIVQIRDNHGEFESVEGVKKSYLINDSTYRKLAPYFSTQ